MKSISFGLAQFSNSKINVGSSSAYVATIFVVVFFFFFFFFGVFFFFFGQFPSKRDFSLYFGNANSIIFFSIRIFFESHNQF